MALHRVAGASLAFLLLRCSPLLMMQPPIPMDMDHGATEIGMAAGGSQAVSGTCFGCSLSDTATLNRLGPGLTGELWIRHQFSEHFRFGAVGSVGTAFATAGGLQAQWDLNADNPAHVALDLECGWYWCSAGVPVAYQNNPDVWIFSGGYVGGTFGGGGDLEPILRLPLGVAWRLGDHAMLLAQTGAVWRPTFIGEGGYAGHSLLLTAGIGFAARM